MSHTYSTDNAFTNVFNSEEELVLALLKALLSGNEGSLSAGSVVREFDYRSGRTDVVAVTPEGEIVAFEAKLTRWRDALGQAYGNTCFAHRSFVVLPWKTAQRASSFAAEFDRRGIGICAIHHGRLVIVHAAARIEPVEPWLSRDVIEASRTTRMS